MLLISRNEKYGNLDNLRTRSPMKTKYKVRKDNGKMRFERQAILDSLYDIVMGTTDDQVERQQIKQSEDSLHMLLPREHWRLLLNIHDNFDMLIHKRGMEAFELVCGWASAFLWNCIPNG